MTNGSTLSLPEIEDRIAIVRDNIRQLIEQAAAFSGAEDEERNADRIAQQTEELDVLVKQRDALVKKKRQSVPALTPTRFASLHSRCFASALSPERRLKPPMLPRSGRKVFTPPSARRP